MNWYLVRTEYGTEWLWAGSSGYQAMRNAEAATGLVFSSYRAVEDHELPAAA